MTIPARTSGFFWLASCECNMGKKLAWSVSLERRSSSTRTRSFVLFAPEMAFSQYFGGAGSLLQPGTRPITRAIDNQRTARTSRTVDPGWVDPGNTGTPLTDPRSRGVFGDQVLTFTCDADRAAFVRTCEERGYHVDGRLGEGYVTVRELDVVAHGPTPIPKNPLDPRARLQTAELVAGHETYATPGARTQYIPTEANEWTARTSRTEGA